MKFWSTLFYILLFPLKKGETRLNLHQVKAKVIYVHWLFGQKAITMGDHIFTTNDDLLLDTITLDEELYHIKNQWSMYGFWFPFLFLLESYLATWKGKHWYSGNRFEEEAKGEKGDVKYKNYIFCGVLHLILGFIVWLTWYQYYG